MATCAVHPEFEAKSRCTRCDKAICAACERTLNERPYCASCEEELTRKLAARQATAASSALSPEAAGAPPTPLPPAIPDLYEPAAGGELSGAPVPPVSNVPLGPPPGMLRPLAFALVAGIAGALVWFLTVRFTDYKLGLVAVGVGWLVGRATVFGAGGRGSAGMAIASVAVALGAMLFGEYLIVNHFAHVAFAAEMPDVEVPAYLGLPIFLSIYGETMGIMDVVFYAIGAYEAWKIPASAA